MRSTPRSVASECGLLHVWWSPEHVEHGILQRGGRGVEFAIVCLFSCFLCAYGWCGRVRALIADACVTMRANPWVHVCPCGRGADSLWQAPWTTSWARLVGRMTTPASVRAATALALTGRPAATDGAPLAVAC